MWEFLEVATFSFFGNKTITTGEGGMVASQNTAVAKMMKHKKNHSHTTRKYYHDCLGFNFRMTNMQAAVGVGQIDNLETILAMKKKIAANYRDRLASVDQIDTKLLQSPEYGINSFWMCSIQCKDQDDRDKLISYLQSNGIDCRPFFPLTSEFPHLSKYKCISDINHSRKVSRCGINLPSYPELSESQIDYITDKISNFFKT